MTSQEEEAGPCPCKGTVCNRGYGWIMGKIQDLAGNFHSGRYNVLVCDSYPEDLMEWDVEDEIFLPPPPPGITSIETMKGFMTHFKGTDKDLQKADRTMQVSEARMEGKRHWSESQ
tara:strand:+ start:2868 stop:3215 length:348 start_codon:yes stop_codon:yes gene_type:complete